MPMGRSRSVSSSSPALPPLRTLAAARADRMPLTMGPRILSRVQIAATPMVPAPMKRAFMRKVAPTIRPEERRVGKEVSVRVDLGGRRIIKKHTEEVQLTTDIYKSRNTDK